MVLLLVLLVLSAGIELACRFAVPVISRIEHRSDTEYRNLLAFSDYRSCATRAIVLGNSLLDAAVQFEDLARRLSPNIAVRRFVVENTTYFDWKYGMRRLLGCGVRPDVIVLVMTPRQLLSSSVRGEYFAHRLLDLGDLFSLAADVGASNTRISDLAFSNLSAFGGIRAEVRKLVVAALLPDLPRLTSLMTARKGSPLDADYVRIESQRRLKTLHDLAGQYHARFVLVIPPDGSPTGEDMASVVQAAGAATGVSVLVPVAPASLPASLYSDGMHMNERGAKIFTPRFADSLQTEIVMMNTEASEKGLPQSAGPPVAAEQARASEFDAFDQFCRRSFGGAKEELTYTAFGKELKFDASGDWVHASVTSASVGFETVLPATSSVEYGPTTSYGQRTKVADRFCYLHLHYLRGLQPGRRYHYRLVASDERGNRIATPDRTLETKADRGIIHIPADIRGPTYVLNRPGATYLVTEDLIVAGRAFQITAKNVTLDLGGHEVVYDNAHMGPPGELVDFPKYIEKSAFGVYTAAINFKILNGAIRQGAGRDGAQVNAIGFNPIYLMSQNNFESGEIAGVTLDYTGDQMSGICTHWTEVCDIHHNVVRDRGTVIMNRHQGCDGIGRLAKGKVHHNLLLRVRHRGLGGKEVYHNEIYGDSFATNSFGIWPVAGGTYYGNRIFGSGYHFVGVGWASGITVRNNFIHIQGVKPNGRSAEYGDQDSGNGIRLTQYADAKEPYKNLLYCDNVIVVKGKYGCQARGVQFFSDPYVENLVFRNNLVKAIVEDDETDHVSCVTTQGNADRTAHMLPILYEDNTFTSNVLNVRFGDYYGVGSRHHFIRCKFVRSGDDKRYRTFFFDSGGLPCKNHVLLDCTFQGGASLQSVSSADAKADADFAVQWTLDLRTVPAAVVTIKDKTGKDVFRGQSDASGQARVALCQYVQKPSGKIYCTPHTVIITKVGKTVTKVVDVDRPQTLEASFD